MGQAVFGGEGDELFPIVPDQHPLLPIVFGTRSQPQIAFTVLQQGANLRIGQTILGGKGDDTIKVSPGNDILDGGEGTDKLSFEEASNGATAT
ncbi:MAG: hypothetical protein HOC74_25995, partial [Gemmatimonadetes bacterium]|nr:hypothetical protein [Gemmatimonadota bacterium]